MITIAIGSRNPVKIEAARDGFLAMFPEQVVSVTGVSVDSMISDQPMSSEVTRQGARNRVAALQQNAIDADYLVGMEGGIEPMGSRYFAGAWIVVADRDGQIGEAASAWFPLPDEIRQLVDSGLELGVANDRLFGEENSKQSGGAIGSLTGGAISRRDLYVPAMTLALIPFRKSTVDITFDDQLNGLIDKPVPTE